MSTAITNDLPHPQAQWIKGIIRVGETVIGVGKMTSRLENFLSAPDSVIFPVDQKSGQITPVPVWIGSIPFREHVDHHVAASAAIYQLSEILKSEEMIATYGHLDYHTNGGEAKMHARFVRMIQHSFMDPACWKDAKHFNALTSMVMGDTPAAPAITLRKRLVSVDIRPTHPDQPDSAAQLTSQLNGYVHFFGVPCRVEISHPLLSMAVSMDHHLAVLAVVSLFNRYYPFLLENDTFTNWRWDDQILLGQPVTPKFLRSTGTLLGRLERNK